MTRIDSSNNPELVQGVLRDCLQSQIGTVVKHISSLCYQLVLHSTNFGTFQKILTL